jgi:hypothetical protein
LERDQRRDQDERQSRHQPVGEGLGGHHHAQRGGAEQHLLERAVGMVAGEKPREREHG